MSDTTNDKRIVVENNAIYQAGKPSRVLAEIFPKSLVINTAIQHEDIDDMIALLTAAKAEMARREAGR